MNVLNIPIGEIFKTTSGGTPSRRQSKYYCGDIPWVKSGELEDNIIFDAEEKITQEAIRNSSTKVFPKGTLLIALYGANIGKLGILGIDAATNQAICAIFDNGFVLTKYAYYFLFYNRRNLISLGIGGAQPNISQDIVRKQLFPLIPYEEQRKIVSIVEEILSDLDNAIENFKKAQEQLKVFRRSILKYAFIDKWNKVPLQSISEAVGGCAFKSSSFKEQGVYQVIRIGNVRPGLIRLNISPIFLDNVDEKIASKYLLKPGDVVISLTGTRKKRDYGYTAVVKERNLLLNQRIAYLRFNESCLPKFFLYYSWTELFKDSFFSSETGNVGQGNVGMKAIQTTEIPLPSIQEQQRIIQFFESRFSVCDMFEESIAENLQKAGALRQSILKQVFEGKLTEQWRKKHKDLIFGENSAESLLKKIKSEKEAIEAKSKGKKKHD